MTDAQRVMLTLIAAWHALRSYQHGNSSPDLAKGGVCAYRSYGQNARYRPGREAHMTPCHKAYYAAVRADDAWQAELERQYGPKAGDARYDARGTASEALRTLREAFRRAEADRKDKCS